MIPAVPASNWHRGCVAMSWKASKSWRPATPHRLSRHDLHGTTHIKHPSASSCSSKHVEEVFCLQSSAWVQLHEKQAAAELKPPRNPCQTRPPTASSTMTQHTLSVPNQQCPAQQPAALQETAAACRKGSSTGQPWRDMQPVSRCAANGTTGALLTA
jgi:hypothetical protein